MAVGFRGGGQVKHWGSKYRLNFLISFIFITVEEEEEEGSV